MGCSAVGMKRKTESKGAEQRLAWELGSNNMAAPLVELSDGFMEQMELAIESLAKMNEWIWMLVSGVKS
jgi:hypothetical protein